MLIALCNYDIINIVQINDSAYVKHINIYLITCLVGYVFYKPLTAYLNMSESVFKYVRRPLRCLLCSLVVLPLTSRSFTPFFQCGAQVPLVLLAAGTLCGEQVHSLTGWCNLFCILMWKTQLFSLDSDRELCCYLERKMSHSSATVWKQLENHWQSTLSRNTTWFQAYFLLWNKQGTPLWNRQPFWFFSIRTYWSS